MAIDVFTAHLSYISDVDCFGINEVALSTGPIPRKMPPSGVDLTP